MDKSLKKGTIWTIIFFLSSFAKTIILTPLMLMHWGGDQFSDWAIILSARAILLFLSDAYVRFIVNEYNLLYHTDTKKADDILSSGLSFLVILSLVLVLGMIVVFWINPHVYGFVFGIEVNELLGSFFSKIMGISLITFIVATTMQTIQRMYAGTKEARGLVWHNLLAEVLLIGLEIVVIALLILAQFSFVDVVFVDSGLIFSISGLYIFYLGRKYKLLHLLKLSSIRKGAKLFSKASQLYASNFFEKLSTDGLVLLLSFFRFDKAAIALFATVRTIVNTPLLAQNLLLNTYTPEMQKHFSLRDTQAFEKLLNFIRLRLAPILCLGIVLCLPLYEPVFNYWTKGEIVYNETFMILMLMMAVFNLYGLSYAFVLKGVNALSQMFVVMSAKCLLILLGFVWAKQNIIAFAWVLLLVEFLSSLLFLPLLSYSYWRKEGLQLKAKLAWLGLIPYFLTAVILSLYFLFAHSLDSLNI